MGLSNDPVQHQEQHTRSLMSALARQYERIARPLTSHWVRQLQEELPSFLRKWISVLAPRVLIILALAIGAVFLITRVILPGYSQSWIGDVDLSDADLRGINLSDAFLAHANLKGADLSTANLKKTSFVGARLDSVLLYDANLEEASLRKCSLKGANLKGANLKRADLRWADLTNANLDDADLEGAYLSNAKVTSEQLKAARSLSGAKLSAVVHD